MTHHSGRLVRSGGPPSSVSDQEVRMRRVGIDIALRAAHKAAVYEDRDRLGRPFSVEQTREGIDELVRRATSNTSEPVEFVMEPTGLAWLPLAAELSRRGHRVYLPKPQ